jgi:hypothetical protein
MQKNGASGIAIVANGSRPIAQMRQSKLICGRFDKAIHRQMRELAAREETTLQDLMTQALNLLFAEYRLPGIP